MIIYNILKMSVNFALTLLGNTLGLATRVIASPLYLTDYVVSKTIES